MTNYSILVVDDQPGETQHLFKRLFEGDDRFKYTQVDTPNGFLGANISNYDAVLLDINLDDWNLKLSEALAIINDRCPVILVSRMWSEDQTHKRVSEALAEAKGVMFIATLVLNWLDGDDWNSYAKSMRFQLSDAIGRNRRKGLLDLKDDDSVSILHLSDPQYGDPNSEDWAAYVEEQIAQFVLRELNREVHFIAITGDITYSGDIKEYDEAKSKLEKMFKLFFPHRGDWRERILLVPGNHDVNLRLAATDRVSIEFTKDKMDDSKQTLKIKTTKAAKTQFPYRKFALAPFRDFAWKLTGDPNWHDAKELNWINDSFRHIGLRFFLLNSTSNIDCDHPNKAGFLHHNIDNLGGEDITHEQPFGIAFSHHGPPESGNTAGDILSDWPKTAPFLNTRRVKLFIHGHGHSRKVDLFNMSEQSVNTSSKGSLKDDELLRIMAPTTHLNGRLRPKDELRGFNLITLSRSNGKVNKVKIESFETSKNNLSPSKDSPWEYHV
ncbi:MAG: hypothetical protein HOO92_00645 [Methylococcaceae bacterium]|nr:hypothetical protein [Methylococcaceae bacterium]